MAGPSFESKGHSPMYRLSVCAVARRPEGLEFSPGFPGTGSASVGSLDGQAQRAGPNAGAWASVSSPLLQALLTLAVQEAA